MGNKMFVAICEFNLASIYEIRGEISRAIELYSKVREKAVELSFERLKITSEVKIIDNRLKIKELCPDREEILSLKKKIPKDLIKEIVNINLLLSDIYLKENKCNDMETVLQEALKLSEKEDYLYGLVKTCYIMSKISIRDKQEREGLRKRAKENFDRLTMVEKKELEYLFQGTDEKIEKRFLIKTQERRFNASLAEVEELRKKKEEFEVFIDVPNKVAFEKVMGEINIFKKKRVLSLMLFLIRNNRGFSSEEIYREVWGWEYEGETSETDVRKNICRVRELIEPDRENLKYILLREGLAGDKGKYYFNDKIKFCLIDDIL
jgi:tellurite resistance protein